MHGRSQTFQNEGPGATKRAQELGGLAGTQNGSPLTPVQSVISFGGQGGLDF